MNPLPIIRDAWYFFRHNLGAIARLCLPMILLEALAQTVLLSSSGEHTPAAYSLLIGLLFYPLYTGALIIFMAARSSGQTPAPANVLALTLRQWPRFAVLTALTNLLFMLGAQFLLLPALYVMVKLAFSEYLLVLREASPLASMRDSFMQTNGHFLRILLCILVVVLPLWILESLSFSLVGAGDVLSLFGVETASSFLQLFSSVVGFRLFMVISEQGRSA